MGESSGIFNGHLQSFLYCIDKNVIKNIYRKHSHGGKIFIAIFNNFDHNFFKFGIQQLNSYSRYLSQIETDHNIFILLVSVCQQLKKIDF